MAENLQRQPKKGILKNSSSFDSNERPKEAKPAAKFDEMNILATLHPADKDYGHMKIEEPKTPYNYNKGESGDEVDSFDASILAARLQESSDNRSAMITPPPLEEEEEEEEDEDLTPEEREKRKSFEVKRKMHYNEFQAVKLARKLMEQDGDEDEDSEDNNKDDKEEDKVSDEDHNMDADDSNQQSIDKPTQL